MMRHPMSQFRFFCLLAMNRTLGPRPEFANQAAASSASAGNKEGAAEPSCRARQHAVSNSKTPRLCCRAVATTPSMRSTQVPARFAVGPAAALASEHRMTKHSLGVVVRLLDPFDPDKGPQ